MTERRLTALGSVLAPIFQYSSITYKYAHNASKPHTVALWRAAVTEYSSTLLAVAIPRNYISNVVVLMASGLLKHKQPTQNLVAVKPSLDRSLSIVSTSFSHLILYKFPSASTTALRPFPLQSDPSSTIMNPKILIPGFAEVLV
jgi:hypothetical protein